MFQDKNCNVVKFGSSLILNVKISDVFLFCLDVFYVYIVLEKYEIECNKCMCFLVKILLILSFCYVQWYFKLKGDDKFILLDVNDEEYQGLINFFFYLKLVVKKKD